MSSHLPFTASTALHLGHKRQPTSSSPALAFHARTCRGPLTCDAAGAAVVLRDVVGGCLLLALALGDRLARVAVLATLAIGLDRPLADGEVGAGSILFLHALALGDAVPAWHSLRGT